MKINMTFELTDEQVSRIRAIIARDDDKFDDLHSNPLRGWFMHLMNCHHRSLNSYLSELEAEIDEVDEVS